MLLRVRDFGANHQDRFPESSTGAQAFGTIAGLVAEIDTHAINKLVVVREARRLKADRRGVMLERMRTIARTSRGIRTESGTLLRLHMPDRTADIAVVCSARAFLQEATAYEDRFVSLGLPATCFAELREATDAFEAAMKDRRTGRAGVAGAQAGIKAGLKRGADTARTLDIIVANTLGSDPVAMAAWNRDRRLVDGRRKGPATGDPEPTPAVAPTDEPIVEPHVDTVAAQEH
jgi:hypothetical protein